MQEKQQRPVADGDRLFASGGPALTTRLSERTISESPVVLVTRADDSNRKNRVGFKRLPAILVGGASQLRSLARFRPRKGTEP